jgi:hypothetical protein
MACGTFTVSGVSQTELQSRMDLFRANKPPPVSVSSNQDPDGSYTITAVFPPCPANTTHSADSVAAPAAAARPVKVITKTGAARARSKGG